MSDRTILQGVLIFTHYSILRFHPITRDRTLASTNSELVRQGQIENISSPGWTARTGRSSNESFCFELPVAPLRRERHLIGELSEIACPRKAILRKAGARQQVPVARIIQSDAGVNHVL